MGRRKRKTLADKRKGSAGCLGIIALVFLAAAAGFTFNTWSFIQRSEIVDAVVIDNEANHSTDGTTYRPTFGFVTPNGPAEASPKMASESYGYAIGDTVEIRYDPGDPTHAVPTGDITNWIIPIILGGFGTVVLLAATATFIGAVRTANRSGKRTDKPTDNPAAR